MIAETDDMFVLVRHGDSIEMAFPQSAPPAEGMQRGFMLKAKLYYKPVRGSRDIEPLPFRGMSIYPYPETENYPQNKEHQEYRKRYNTREYGHPAIQSMRNLLPGVHEAETSAVDARPARPGKEQATSQQPVNKQGSEIAGIVTSEPETHPSLWQWLGTIVMKSFLAISAVLRWLKTLVGL